MDNRDVAALGDRTRLLKELTLHAGWTELHRVHKEKREAYAERLAKELLRKGAVFDQRELDYQAGYFDAWRSILAEPKQAEKRFEDALRKNERDS